MLGQRLRSARRTREPVWLNSHYKLMWLDFRLATLNAEPHSPPSGVQLSRPGDEVQILCAEGQLDRALPLLLQMNTVPSVEMYRSLLNACTKKKALAHAKKVHAHIGMHGMESTGYLGESVVKTLVKCGGFEDALRVFNKLSGRTIVSWTAVICGYVNAQQCLQALRMYRCMLDEGLEPNRYTFLSLFKACGFLRELEEGKRIHAEASRYGCASDFIMATCLIDMYAKCGSILDAKTVFDGLSKRDLVSWNVMLSACAELGEADIALQLYKQMQEEGVRGDVRTYVTTLQAGAVLADKGKDVFMEGQSIKPEALETVKAIHEDAWTDGYESDIFICCTLLCVYGKCGSILDAQKVFAGLSEYNVVSCNAMLAAYSHQGLAEKALELYEQMQKDGVSPDVRTLVSVLQACGMLAERDEGFRLNGQLVKPSYLGKVQVVHADARRKGLNSSIFLGNTLVSTYGKCGSILDACMMFDGLLHQDLVSWNSMLMAYALQGQAGKVLQLYEQFRETCESPDVRTFVLALQACGMLGDAQNLEVEHLSREKLLQQGKVIHADTWLQGYHSDDFICSALVSMYGRCGSILDALHVLECVSKPDVVSWNAMLTSYVHQGQAEKALQLYQQMLERRVSPDVRTYVTTLQACGMLAAQEEDMAGKRRSTNVKLIEKAKALHADACRKGYNTSVFLGSALISTYGKCGSMVEAENIFGGLWQRSAMEWTAMIEVYVQHGEDEKALWFYKEMREEGVSPNEVTLLCVLQACCKTGSLDACRQIHTTLCSSRTGLTLPLGNTLIHAYGQCSSMGDAQTVFDTLSQPDVVSCTALIAGYARQGDWVASLQCYEDMLVLGIQPNSVTFLSLISACSHAGLVDKGVEYFVSMSRDFCITPDIEHYVSVIDLLGRAGCFATVEHLLLTMPMEPDMAMWSCLLGACRKHGEIVLGKQAFDCAVNLEPRNAASYELMFNIYADAGLWDRAKEVKHLGQQHCAWKKPPGLSWVEHVQVVETFAVGDLKHPQHNEIYELLAQVSLEVKGSAEAQESPSKHENHKQQL